MYLCDVNIINIIHIKMNQYIRIWYRVSTLPFMDCYDILCARMLLI